MSLDDLFTNYYTHYINSINANNNIDLLKECNQIKFCVEEHGGKVCPISLEEFKDGDELVELPCKHVFLKENITKWFENKPSCPVCREKITVSDQIQNQNQNQNQTIVRNILDETINNITQILLENDIDDPNEQLDVFFEIY